MADLKKPLGINAGYLAELYERYLKDYHSVSPQVRRYFETTPPELNGQETERLPAKAKAGRIPVAEAEHIQALVFLTQTMRQAGYQAANLDPLGLHRRSDALVAPGHFGLSEAQLEQLPPDAIATPLSAGAASAREVVARLKQTYCGAIGYEFTHISDPVQRAWFQEAVESGRFYVPIDDETGHNLLERLTRVESFEKFLHHNFPGQKWFSVEGNNTLVLILDEIIRQVLPTAMRTLAMGMAHRGRLNVLAHIMGKSYASILAEFKNGLHRDGNQLESCAPAWMHDVKYHMGAQRTLASTFASFLDLVLLSNPSHLEMVTPVVLGAVRAHQEQNGRSEPPQSNHANHGAALAIVIHGDAGFAGQGVVSESLNLAGLAGYSTGGSIHIIANNQIGFTTEPAEAHSATCASDLARGYDIPIIHVNADAVDQCLAAARLAFAYRQQFNRDVLIDHVGYRRYGHNEGDEPSFTQPVMYRVIRNHPTAREILARELIEYGRITPQEVEEQESNALSELKNALDTLARVTENGDRQDDVQIEAPELPERYQEQETGVVAETLVRLNQELNSLPEGFNLHPRLEQLFQRRRNALKGEGSTDWAHAEALALATILAEGTAVRLTGQDTERGTFSQRHAVLHDVETGERFVPLQSFTSSRATFSVFNSPLSEVAPLAYEYGYSAHALHTLVLWEAQFGDFVNNAQGVVDEFIASAQAKWGVCSGLTLLLPHGYEGQGPDHSNAHLDRFLQLCADSNIQVVYCTTAAQYFHLLRRQAHSLAGGYPRPLVVMTPKSLLRHPAASSGGNELFAGGFQPVLDDPRAREYPEQVRRVLLCTGKVFIDLVSSDACERTEDIAIIRLEELYPFPQERFTATLSRYHRVEEVVWVQEEPQNWGAWGFVSPRLQELLPQSVSLSYSGRPPRPSPAEGSLRLHRAEQQRIIREALAGKVRQ